eukprot:1825818-Prymnesium_polylepis.1
MANAYGLASHALFCCSRGYGQKYRLDERLADECNSYSAIAHWGAKTPVIVHTRYAQECRNAVGDQGNQVV